MRAHTQSCGESCLSSPQSVIAHLRVSPGQPRGHDRAAEGQRLIITIPSLHSGHARPRASGFAHRRARKISDHCQRGYWCDWKSVPAIGVPLQPRSQRVAVARAFPPVLGLASLPRRSHLRQPRGGGRTRGHTSAWSSASMAIIAACSSGEISMMDGRRKKVGCVVKVSQSGCKHGQERKRRASR